MKQSNKKSGFTLLELLIAITLSIVIFLILFSAMRLGYESQEKGSEAAEVTQKVRIIGDRITWLIRGAYPFFRKESGEKKFFFEGESERIGFVTTSVDVYGQGPEDRAGLKWVSIFKDNNNLTIREKVFFLEDVFDDSGGKVYVLDPEVKELEFEYFDIPEDETEGDWVSEWDPDENEYLPSAVRVNIVFTHNGKTIDIPEIIVRINTNKRDNF
jgi:type II secretion system protein J